MTKKTLTNYNFYMDCLYSDDSTSEIFWYKKHEFFFELTETGEMILYICYSQWNSKINDFVHGSKEVTRFSPGCTVPWIKRNFNRALKDNGYKL